ncbi:MAG TPA: glycosyltransferase [Candidatus Dormibacteraeota bacterium]|nr:glycosyltransferase [Candidatus Dormibacteraeota bacterium]
MAPLVSVIINTYNYGRFIEECIDSVLAQDFPVEQREILVIDDGSTDDTAERVKKYGDRVQYFYKENGDQCSAVSFGVTQCKGELIALLDGDDVWIPNKLSLVAQEFAKNPRAVMVYHKYVFWDCRHDSVWEPLFFQISGDLLADPRKLIPYNAAPTSSLVIRRDAFQRLSKIPLDRPFMYDCFLISAVPFLGPIACVPEVLTKNRVHGNNRWAAEQAGPSRATLQRRVARRAAAIEIIRNWTRENAPKSSRRQARILVRKWQLVLDNQKFKFDPPNRFRQFVHLYRHAMLETPVTSRSTLAYRFIHAFGVLIFGKHAHYLEGVRTRVRKLRQRFQTQPATAEQSSESAGNVR